MGRAAEIYAQQLFRYQHGHALWMPEPSDDKEIRIGDVGYIDEDGQFHRLFNATVGQCHPYNAGGVPVDFQILPVEPRSIQIKNNFMQPGALSSASVTSSTVGGEIGA